MRGDETCNPALGARGDGSLSGSRLRELASEISAQGGDKVARIVLVHDVGRALSEYSFVGESGEVLRRLQVPRISTPEGSRPWTGSGGAHKGMDSLVRLIAKGGSGR